MDNGQLTAREARLAVMPLDQMFSSLRTQLANIREWNDERRWGLSATDLGSVDLTPRPQEKLLVVDLIAVYLSGNAELNGIRRTCHELWTVAAEQQPHSWSWELDWGEWRDHLKPVRLLNGIVHRPGIRRVTIDLGAYFEPGQHIRPSRVRGRYSAHAEVLAAAAHFPRWIRAMDGQAVPYTWIPGYEVMFWNRPSSERLPALSWNESGHRMSLTAAWAEHSFSGWAAPTCTRSSPYSSRGGGSS
jgi:hypothetical protein